MSRDRRDHKPVPKRPDVPWLWTECLVCGESCCRVVNKHLSVKTRVYWRHAKRWEKTPDDELRSTAMSSYHAAHRRLP